RIPGSTPWWMAGSRLARTPSPDPATRNAAFQSRIREAVKEARGEENRHRRPYSGDLPKQPAGSSPGNRIQFVRHATASPGRPTGWQPEVVFATKRGGDPPDVFEAAITCS